MYFRHNRNFYVLLFVILLFMLALPTLAQDGTTPTIPPTNPTLPDGTYFTDHVLIGVFFITSVFLALFGAAIYGLYQSAPAWLKPLLEAMLAAGVGQVDTYVHNTANTIDDALWNERIRKYLEDNGLVLPSNPTPSQSKSSSEQAVG